MKVTANIFWLIGLFFIAAGTLYGFWVEWTEWAGIPAILALGAMSWMIAWYLQATDKKFGLGPSDDEDGEITDYAGTYGAKTSGSELSLQFVKDTPSGGKNIGSRFYLMASDTKYQMFTLLGNEFTFDVDASELP